jgi:penicillin-binding protein 2
MALQDEISAYTKRRVLTTILAAMFLLFLGRLFQLQMIYSKEYGKKSEENSIRTLPREPIRGAMIDRNGVLVVDNRPAFTVTVMPFEFDRRAIPRLSTMLGLDTAFIGDRLRKGEAYSRFAPVKIKRDIDFRTLAQLEEHRDVLPGVDYQVESKRYYTTTARAPHLLGYTKEISENQLRQLGTEYTAGDVAGAIGIEAEYEERLHGRKGEEFSTVNARGQVIGRFDGGKHDVAPVEGNDLLLTMDFGLQQFAESLMTDHRGAVVAIDPTDGGLLALVSKPDYDLSQLTGVTPPELWRRLNSNPASPLFNRATLTKYPPGSTYKMILAIAALETGTVTPQWRITCNGAFKYGNKVFKDLHVHGSVDMLEAIQKSCNVYFYQLMLKVGLDAWSHYGTEFGFGQLTGIDILEENPGLLPTTGYMNRRYGPEGWTKGFLPSLAIGQGELGVTPLQMACYAMALANKGEYYQPHAVRAARNTATHEADTLAYQSRKITLSPATWDVVREGLRRVVEEPGGTGSMARVKGMEVAGKTGTAQNPHGPDHAWFIGFAPYDHPRIAIAVLIENAGFGGSFAAPIAGLCIERYLYGGLVRRLPNTVVPPVADAAKHQGM